MANLQTKFVGLSLRSPIIVGSAGITETVDRMRKCEENGAAAVVMKSYFEEERSRRSPTPRFRVLKDPMASQEGFTFMSYEQASGWDIHRYAEEVTRAKAELTIAIIPSINCVTLSHWAEAARILERAGADAVELNTSCPHGSITFCGGPVEQVIFETVEAVRKAVRLPLIAKISPMLTSPIGVVKRLEEIGVQGVTIFNRMTGLDIDIDEEAPVMHGGYAGHGGPWAIQYPLRWITQIRPAVKIDISASGGVSKWHDVVKYILAGADTVQTCTAIYMGGYEIVRQLVGGLERFMERKGYTDLAAFRGKAVERILSAEKIDRRRRFLARIRLPLDAPCKAACPASVPAQSYVRAAAEGRFEEALQFVRSKNPFQSICGRACYHPCESECTRQLLDDPIAIRAIKRFITDWGKEHSPLAKLPVPVTKPSGKKVAIIGAGPAGLTAAHDLALLGHKVAVFEALSEPGGMLVAGIPGYRLPRELVREEIDRIASLGVEIHTGTALGRDLSVSELKRMGYGAILIAIGCHIGRKLGIPGENSEGVLPALEFLKELNLGNHRRVHGRVAVVGGGNAAIDAARCAVRLGASEVYLIYRRTRAEMPATDQEINDAEAEGVRVLYLARPLSIVSHDGRLSGLKCEGSFLAAPGKDGRRQPAPVSGVEYMLPVDMVIPAVSQAPDPAALEGLNLRDGGTVVVEDQTGRTSLPGVFAAGDVAGRPGSIIEAIADGKRVALAIDRYLRGEPVRCEEVRRVVDAYAVLARSASKPRHARINPTLVPPEERIRSFNEAELPMTESQVRQEASRCLACGCGVGCDVCKKVCIYSAVQPVCDTYQVDLDKCDGCGLCTQVCPNQNIEMVPAGEREL